MSAIVEIDDLGFPIHYGVSEAFPDRDDKVYEFDAADAPPRGGLAFRTGKKAISLKIIPGNNPAWFARFVAGPEGITGVFATPNANIICVVATGQGYWVPVREPTAYSRVRSMPIKKILRVPHRDLIVFADYTRLTGYGPEGFVWQTGNLSWDGLKIQEISEDAVAGFGWDSPGNRDVPFTVDTLTGRSTGGASSNKT